MSYHQKNRYETIVGGKPMLLENGDLAKLAGGAVTITVGGAVILATATASKSPREGIDFFPLSVDFEERMYAVGRVPGGFFRREGRPSTQAILTARLTDRPLRPLFPKGYRNDVQIILTALSADEENPLDVLSINAASAALTISSIPFDGPIAAVRVGYIDDQFVINPTFAEIENSLLDLRLAGTESGILMVEAGANELPEHVILEAMRVGHEAMQPIIALQNRMRAEIGKEKTEVVAHLPSPEAEAAVTALLGDRLQEIISSGMAKEDRNKALDEIKAGIIEQLGEQHESWELKAVFQGKMTDIAHQLTGKPVRSASNCMIKGCLQILEINRRCGIMPYLMKKWHCDTYFLVFQECKCKKMKCISRKLGRPQIVKMVLVNSLGSPPPPG